MKTLAWIHKHDVSFIIRLINSQRYSTLYPICRIISKSGDGWLIVLIGLLSLVYQGVENPLFMALLWGFAIERSLYYLLKNTLKRQRPFNIITIEHHVVPSDAFSFPSGHTSSAFLFAMVIGHFYPALMLLLLVWAALVGFSRIVLGVHFLTDVLIGMLMGVSIAEWVLSWT